MKKIILPLIVFTFSYCSTNKNTSAKVMGSTKIETACPENGKCTFEIIQNKSLNIKTDGIGKTYFELRDDPEKIVFKYKLDLNANEMLQDAGYTEEILFETDKDYGDFVFSDEKLKESKAIFQVMCFCRDKAGSYKITEGNIEKKGNSLSISLPKLVEDQKTNNVKIIL
jgi:hypothetical protein